MVQITNEIGTICISRDYFLLNFLTGMRPGETQSLRWSGVADNAIRLKGEDAKTGEPRCIICTGELGALLKRREEARTPATHCGQ
ncbi:MAG: hypothetical protein WAK48_07385 [Candidatus Acidiferrum sp.]|jgi:integrase